MLDLADVVVDVRTQDAQPHYSYRVPEHIASVSHPGVLVVVSFHGRTALGYIVARRKSHPDKLGFPLTSLKPLIGIARGAKLTADLLSLIRFAAAEYGGPLWLALYSAVPQASRSRMRSLWEVIPGAPMPGAGTPGAALVGHLLAKGGEARTSEFDEEFTKVLETLRRKGIVRKAWELLTPPVPRQVDMPYRVADAETMAEFMELAGKQRKSQAKAAEKLIEKEGRVLSPADIKSLGISSAIRDKLVAAGLLKQQSYRDVLLGSVPPEENLLPAQLAACRRIAASLAAGRYEEFLLHGVTASGKTEVYLRAASECLSLGRTVLILVPEIALAGQIVERVRERFGDAATIIHSGMGQSQRYSQWQRIARGDTPIVVGPRSAVFAPLPALGLVVIDEEHEGSYKQGNLLRYDARLIGERRVREAGAVLVRGSATPDIESYYRATSGRYTLLPMPERVTKQNLPTIELLDLRELRPTQSALAAPLEAAMHEALERQEQVILFLNRRAYAPFLLCRDCGEVPMCHRCSVSMAFHQKAGVLRCHHCGAEREPPDKCPKCNGTRVRPMGLGTQRVEEDVVRQFPDANVVRLDRDVRDPQAALQKFRSGDADILIGTQIVAKGLDFPRVSLVGVVNADTGLHMPDFRAAERTFQLLVQVAGRAGRGDAPGKVMIQTFSPGHPAIQCALKHDYLGFYRREVEIRKEAGYPPFRRLAHIMVAHQQVKQAEEDAERIGLALRASRLRKLEVLGPAPSVPERVQGLNRRSLLLKFPPDARPGPALSELLRKLSPIKSRVTLDVDPQGMG